MTEKNEEYANLLLFLMASIISLQVKRIVIKPPTSLLLILLDGHIRVSLRGFRDLIALRQACDAFPHVIRLIAYI